MKKNQQKSNTSARGHVLLVLEATIGGTRRHVRELAVGLVRDGWDVDLAYSAKRDPDFSNDLVLFKTAGIGLHEISMRRGFAPFSDLIAIRKLRSLIKRISPDIVHMHSTKAGLVGRLASLFLPVKRIYSPHCFAFNMRSGISWLYKLTEHILAPCTDMLIAVCGTEALQAASVGYRKGHIKVIYNGIEKRVRTIGISSTEKRKKSIAFIGRNAQQKGLCVLAEAFEILKKEEPDAQLTVMSDVKGDLKKRLLALEAEILPFSPNASAEELLSKSEIIAIPSLWEAFPYSVLEAFDNETAIVASDVGGIAEATSDDAAILVPPGSPKDLAEALRKILLSPMLRKKLTDAGKNDLELYSFKTMIKSVESVYFNLTGLKNQK